MKQQVNANLRDIERYVYAQAQFYTTLTAVLQAREPRGILESGDGC